MNNDYLAWEMSKQKIADYLREADEARLANSVAGPDPTVRIATLLVLAIAGVLLMLMF